MKYVIKSEWFDNLDVYFKGQDIAIAMGLITQFAMTEQMPDLTCYSKKIQKFLPILLQSVLQALLQAKKRQQAGSQGGKKSFLKKEEEKQKILLQAKLQAEKEDTPLAPLDSPLDVSPHTPLLNPPIIPPKPPEDRADRESKDSLVRELFPKNFCEDVLHLYNEICVSLPKAQEWALDADRKEKIKAKAKEFRKKGWDPMETFRTLFTKMEESDFLSGRAKDFKANFAWVVDYKGNWKKILEGKYDNNKRSNGTGGPPTADELARNHTGYGEYRPSSDLKVIVIGE